MNKSYWESNFELYIRYQFGILQQELSNNVINQLILFKTLISKNYKIQEIVKSIVNYLILIYRKQQLVNNLHLVMTPAIEHHKV